MVPNDSNKPLVTASGGHMRHGSYDIGLNNSIMIGANNHNNSFINTSGIIGSGTGIANSKKKAVSN
jgi:hypothetical protein